MLKVKSITMKCELRNARDEYLKAANARASANYDASSVECQGDVNEIMERIRQAINSLDDNILREFLRGNDYALFREITLLFQIHVPAYDQITESRETYQLMQSRWQYDLSSFYGFFRKGEIIIPSRITSSEIAQRAREL